MEALSPTHSNGSEGRVVRPAGRPSPLMPPRMSDLVGGVYGPGASVASTGLNAGRAVIKTAHSRAAGDTWEDLMEYYLVRDFLICPDVSL